MLTCACTLSRFTYISHAFLTFKEFFDRPIDLHQKKKMLFEKVTYYPFITGHGLTLTFLTKKMTQNEFWSC